MPSEAAEVLERWRKVESALAETKPGSGYAAALEAEAVRLRDEYERMLDEDGPTVVPEADLL
jgi:hypothetical protein